MLQNNLRLMIRPATVEDSEKLTEIAFAAKRHWGYPESWIEAWREDLTITPDSIEKSVVYVAVENNRLIGFYALNVGSGKTELDHLWVLPEMIGRGVGRQLLQHAIDQTSAMRAKSLEILSDPNAEGFYLKSGAIKVGEVTYEIEGRERKLPRLRIEIQS